MQSSGAVVGANRMVRAPPLLVPAPAHEEPAPPQTAWASQRTLAWAPGMKVSRYPSSHSNTGLPSRTEGEARDGDSCPDHPLIPWPPLDGQLRPRPLSAGRRAVSVHEDQLQAPVGEGGHLPVCLSAGDGGRVDSRTPFMALVLGGGHQ